MAETEFCFCSPGTGRTLILARPLQQLGDVIQAAITKPFSFENHITFAEVNDRDNEVAVVPSILCRELKPNGKVTAIPKKGATPLPKKNEKDVDDKNGGDREKKISKKQIIFYVDSTNSGITKNIPNTAYKGKLIAICARKAETLGDAMSRDGRISDDVKLSKDDKNIPLQYQASKFVRQTFSLTKINRKRKRAAVDDDLKRCEKKSSGNSNAAKFCFSGEAADSNDPFTHETGKALINHARQNALDTFVKPGAKRKTDSFITKMVQKFGKTSPKMPAEILGKLARAKKSVGYIHCGDYAATCFLLTHDAIITSRHVISSIMTLRNEATDTELYRQIFVNFGYDKPDQQGDLQAEVDETYEELHGLELPLDYAICYLKDPPLLKSLPVLGPLIRTGLPLYRGVALIGHPEKQHKLLEFCNVIPGNQWHEILHERASEALNYCAQNPLECGMGCIHMYRENTLEDLHPKHGQLSYDSSFFHGSSGSPVFNADGHIIAMHTMGYPYFQRSNKYSLMEFGLTFAAIYHDVKVRYGNDYAKHFFPKCQE